MFFKKEVTDENAKKCIEKVGVSEESVVKIMDGDFTGTDKAVEVRNRRTFNGK